MYLCLSIKIVIMHDDLALFLKCKHVDGCSFFVLMLQYICGSRGGGGGGGGGPDPLENHKFYGFLYKLAFRPPWIKLDPPGKCWTPLKNVGPPLKTWQIIVFFEINH